ncbi:hypothetical protein [Bradyrhizobium sp. KB893862 SZCCT0404]|uniref:hypothetical protein n=1 Tax=Bradyrhizobium sp. KB893862 SZCCT0404 TaxID=2807672 RepID=UPI0032DE9FDE
MLIDAFTLVEDRSALFCLSSVRWAAFVEFEPVWFCCAWLLPDAGGLADWVELPDGWLVWAWFDCGVVVLVCAWLGEFEDAGACEVLVLLPELGDWPVALWLVDEGGCVWAELVDEGFEVCAELLGAVLDVDGLVVEADGELVVEGCLDVDVESC